MGIVLSDGSSPTPRDPGKAGAAWPGAGALLALAAVYYCAGKLGLKLAFVHASATAVWPPTGIAIAAFLLLGRRAWPAIFAGAFLVNMTTTGSILTCTGIAAGNTLEGLLGATLVERFANGRRAFERPRDVFRFALLAALLSTTVSATCGVASLVLGGVAPQGHWASIWLTWWLGDAGGDLVVAPPLLLWGTSPRPRWAWPRAFEALLMLLATLVAGLALFAGFVPSGAWQYPASFLCIPLLLWAAFRFGPRAAATTNSVLSGIAIWGALNGVGPFVRPSPNESLLLLQAFMGVISITTLALAAAVYERQRVEEALARTAAIVSSSDDAILGKTLSGTIVSWNPGAERLYGYSADEIVGRNVSTLVPQGRPDDTPRILERILRGETVEHYETVRASKEGLLLTVSLTVSPIRDASGKIVGASAIARDITERKRAEQRLALQSAVTRVLQESLTLREAAPGLLRIACKELGWDVGELWLLDADQGVLRRADRWPQLPGEGAQDETALPRGSDLPGYVCDSGRHVWIEDLASDRRFGPWAAKAGLRAAVAGPIWAEGGIVGALIVYSREARPGDTALLDTMVDLNSRIGLFIDRVRAFEALGRLKKAVETLDLGVTITDMKGRILYTNPAEGALHGYPAEELVGKHVSLFMPASWAPASGRPTDLRGWRRETVNVRKDGTIFPVQLLSDAVTDADGVPIGVVTVCEEISERKRAEQALRTSEERYRLLFERNLAGVCRITPQGQILECNEAFARILGYATQGEVRARSALDLYFDRQDLDDAFLRLREKGAITNFELRMRRKDGTSVWVLQNATLLAAEGGQELVEGTIIDITERKLAEQRIEFHAYHDTLTHLPNRMYLKDRMDLALAHARRSAQGLTVLFLDLDHFKAVNDRLGHALGDRLLIEVARRLRSCVREGDTVARVGGDEFVLLLADVRNAEDAAHVARKLLSRVEEPFHIDGNELAVTSSVGIALYPEDGADAETLLKNADSAMYRAKDLGRGGYQLCDPAADRKALERMALQHQLRYALERDELAVVYQPEVHIGSGRIAEMEALLRWRHPERGMIPPAEFIPLAEDMGLIGRLGEWVLRKACTQASVWKQMGLPSVRVAVNLSMRQFRQTDFKAVVERVLTETSLPPRQLDLEITETAAMHSFDLAVPVLRDFAAMGIVISIDDFGTGYSSLSRLKLLPVQRLKIDGSFIAGLGRQTQETAIVKAIIRMAHSLGLGVVAECVETPHQIALLKRLRCDEIQGHVVSHPVDENDCERLLARSYRY